MVLDKEDGKWAGPGRGDGGGRERAVRGLTRGPGRPPPAGYRRGFAGLGASRPRWARGWRPRSVPARPGSGCAPGAGLQLGKSEYGAAGGSGFVRGSSAGFPLSRSPLSFGRGASAPARCEPARRGAVRNRGAAAGLRRFRSRGPAPPGPGSRRGRPSEPSDYAGGAPLGPPRCRSRTRAWRRRGSELPRPGRAPKDPLVRPPRAEGKRGKRRPRGMARVMPCGCGEELSLGGDLAQNGAMQVLLGCCAEWGGGGREKVGKALIRLRPLTVTVSGALPSCQPCPCPPAGRCGGTGGLRGTGSSAGAPNGAPNALEELGVGAVRRRKQVC